MRNAGDPEDASAAQALSALCDAYWYPPYAFIRRSGNTARDSGYLTQEFFARLLNGRIPGGEDPTAGKFRDHLLKSMQAFLAGAEDPTPDEIPASGIPDNFNPEWAEEWVAWEAADPEWVAWAVADPE